MTSLTPFSRRTFLIYAGTTTVGAFALAACGASAGSSAPTLPKGVALVQRFPNNVLVPGTVRLPISLAVQKGVLTDADTDLPVTLSAKVIETATGKTVIQQVTATKHTTGVPQPYWPFTVTVDTPGIYSLVVDGGPADGAAFQILQRTAVQIPLIGDALPPFDTPTTTNNNGVDPICTRVEGTCPFHSVTLTDALRSGKPVVYLIGTPAYCQTGTCAPALDALIAVQKNVGDSALFVHADVYSDSTATTPAPAVSAYNMSYEPALYITDARGILRARLDAIFNEEEVRDVLLSVAGIS